MTYDVNEVAKHYANEPQELSQLIYKISLIIADASGDADFELESSGEYWNGNGEITAKLVGEVEAE